MENIPFEIPGSLKTYVDQFEKDPDSAIDKLDKQLAKRGPDAVGHILMAWFHYLQGHHDEAVRYAYKAKIYAPGSPFLEYIHYNFSHPENFKAWMPETGFTEEKESVTYQVNLDLIHDLDTLINRLGDTEHSKINLDANIKTDDIDLSDSSSQVDDIASETLASIYTKQGKIEEAIDAYRKLCERNPEKKAEYEKEIERLKKDKK